MRKWILTAAGLLAAAALGTITARAQGAAVALPGAGAATTSQGTDTATQADAKAQAPQWEWHKLGKGVQYSAWQGELFGRTEYITAVRYRQHRHKTRILHAPGSSADSTSALGELAGAIAAVNASYFNVKTLQPVTYLKTQGRRVASTTKNEFETRTDGILAIKSNGAVHMFPCDTADYDLAARKFHEAIAAGPVLLQDGKPAREAWPNTSFYYKFHPRTIVGKDYRGRVYLIVIDGRFKGQGDGASIDEAVQICRMFGLKEALNLDGGGSCALWTPQTGVLSHPYDNHKFDHYGQRIVPNILYIK